MSKASGIFEIGRVYDVHGRFFFVHYIHSSMFNYTTMENFLTHFLSLVSVPTLMYHIGYKHSKSWTTKVSATQNIFRLIVCCKAQEVGWVCSNC